MSWLFLRELVTAEAARCGLDRLAGEESRDEIGEACAEGDDDPASACDKLVPFVVGFATPEFLDVDAPIAATGVVLALRSTVPAVGFEVCVMMSPAEQISSFVPLQDAAGGGEGEWLRVS